MKETGKEHFIITKAYEIAYALFRLASAIGEKDFAGQLQASGTALLVASSVGDYAAAERSLRVMECLIKFGGDVNMIGIPNVDVMTREIYALDAAIAERKGATKADEVNIAEIFSKVEKENASTPVAPVTIFEAEKNMNHGAYQKEPAIRQSANDSAIRQSAILGRIRQFGSCRLKDIQEILPDISERTLRYDLQTLLEQGLIERIGNAGPSVFYRAAPERAVDAEAYVPEIR